MAWDGAGEGKDDGVICWMGRWEDDGKRNDGMNQSGGVDFRDFTPNDPITGLVQCSTQHISEYTSANNVQLCMY